MTDYFERMGAVLRAITSTANPRFRRYARIDFRDICWGYEDVPFLEALLHIIADDDRSDHGLDCLIGEAVRTGSEEALAWICYIVDGPGSDPSSEAEAPTEISRRMHPVSPRLALTPEWRVLMSLLQSEDGGSALSFNRNPDGGYENGTFLTRPYAEYSTGGDGGSYPASRPNLLFKPTGLEIGWVGEPFSEAYSNHELSEGEFRKMIRMCAESVMDDIREAFA